MKQHNSWGDRSKRKRIEILGGEGGAGGLALSLPHVSISFVLFPQVPLCLRLCYDLGQFVVAQLYPWESIRVNFMKSFVSDQTKPGKTRTDQDRPGQTMTDQDRP